MRLNVRAHAHIEAVWRPFLMATLVAGALLAGLAATPPIAHAQACATNGDCDDAIGCTTDACVSLSCENTDNCGGGQACNPGANSCQSTAGDPDNDGLADASDPCPFDARNACFGLVALNPSTARPMRKIGRAHV